MADTETTEQNATRGLRPFHPGAEWKGNAAGRPKGSRHKLSGAFLEALSADFEKHGVKAIEDCRTEDPSQYVKIVASLLPKEFTINANPLEEMTDEQLIERLTTLNASLGGFIARSGADQSSAGTSAGGEDVSTLRPN